MQVRAKAEQSSSTIFHSWSRANDEAFCIFSQHIYSDINSKFAHIGLNKPNVEFLSSRLKQNSVLLMIIFLYLENFSSYQA